MNTHQLHILLVVDTRVLSCVANSLQERRFASISLTDYKDTKASILPSEVIGFIVRPRAIVPHRYGWCHGEVKILKKECVGTPQLSCLYFSMRENALPILI